MTGDKIVAVIAIIAMLSLVVPRMVSNPRHQAGMLKMAGFWVLIIVVIIVAVIALR